MTEFRFGQKQCALIVKELLRQRAILGYPDGNGVVSQELGYFNSEAIYSGVVDAVRLISQAVKSGRYFFNLDKNGVLYLNFTWGIDNSK